jgi:predicted membrane protein
MISFFLWLILIFVTICAYEKNQVFFGGCIFGAVLSCVFGIINVLIGILIMAGIVIAGIMIYKCIDAKIRTTKKIRNERELMVFRFAEITWTTKITKLSAPPQTDFHDMLEKVDPKTGEIFYTMPDK